MRKKTKFLLTLVLVAIREIFADQIRTGQYHNGTSCYDESNKAQRCIPPFENAAFDVLMTATNTCAEQLIKIDPYASVEYCIQTISTRSNKSCDNCRPYEHSSRALTDINSEDKITWWQSDTMYEGIQYPSQVNLTLNLPKTFDITYVRLLFQSPRPESFSIYKRTSKNSSWIPYQFYSATCRDTYGLPDSRVRKIAGENTRAFCTSEYSDISPLTGGNVAFSTLEGRPSAYQFESSAELQEWVTATDIRIVLDRLNTFGDEVFSDPQVLKSYFYAIADIAVGARCKCNGHAKECLRTADGNRYCLCEHNTGGADCDQCLPFYNDLPWGRATAYDAHECQKCDCNGFSDRCFFDRDLFEKTGHGGHCVECRENRAGVHCEKCEDNYFVDAASGKCVPCECSAVGSKSLQCNSKGRCHCKPGVDGTKCDRCKSGFYDFEPDLGCKSCECLPAGTQNQTVPICDAATGSCNCKRNVEGKQCRDCKPGFFNMDEANEHGCSSCFCYGHSSDCVSAPGYSRALIESRFNRNLEKWTVYDRQLDAARQPKQNPPIMYNIQTQSITIRANYTSQNPFVYFAAPEKFLGDKRFAYNRLFKFSLYFDQIMVGSPAVEVILEGANGEFHVSTTLPSQGATKLDLYRQKFEFRLNENYWQPRLPFLTFMAILSNLTAIRIRALYPQSSVLIYLDDVQLELAQRTGSISNAELAASWIERCNCPKGYIGQFCESCDLGFRHTPDPGQETQTSLVHKRASKSFQTCVPCVCNGHSTSCDSETGKCICRHNTAGDNCDQCAKGYYGNARLGTESDCKACGCPNNGACMQLSDDDIICLECPTGYAGPRCNICADGYFGDPTGNLTGTQSACQACDCNNNIDRNAIGNCNRTTGECLKCIYNTDGAHCERCLPGFYGEALAGTNDCKPCNCNEFGTVRDAHGQAICNPVTGQCSCLDNVRNEQCNECVPGYYNLMSGTGCEACSCNGTGTRSGSVCDQLTGQCDCWDGIVGRTCNLCNHYHYDFRAETGCKPCNCDAIGSLDLQCDVYTGQCKCIENVEGRQCERCKENKYDKQRGCLDCPYCYRLVQEAVHNHTSNLSQLDEILAVIANNPLTDSDQKKIPEFEEELKKVQKNVEELIQLADLVSDKGFVANRIAEMKGKMAKIDGELKGIENGLVQIGPGNAFDVEELQKRIDQSHAEIKLANEQLRTNGKEMIDKAQEKIANLGQRNTEMTEISKKAREHVDTLNRNVTRIQELANRAKNISSEAYESLISAMQLQKNATETVRDFDYKLTEFETKLNEIGGQVQRLQNETRESNRRALEAFEEATELRIPDSLLKTNGGEDFHQLISDDRNRSETEAYRILNETMKLGELMTELREGVSGSLTRAGDVLNSVQEQQALMDELLSDVDAANERADRALETCNRTLADAQKVYDTLAEFDKQVQINKELANNAVDKMPEIESKLSVIRARLETAAADLDNSYENADRASRIALEIEQNLTDPMLNDTDQLQEITKTMKQQSRSLSDETVSLPDRLTDTSATLDDFDRQIDSNSSLIAKAKQKVSQAESSTYEANRKVTKTLNELETIERELTSVPDLTDDDLDRLEQKLQALDQELGRIDLDARLEQLLAIRSSQSNQVKQYEKQFEQLESQVRNIEDIMRALPDGCFKETNLEV